MDIQHKLDMRRKELYISEGKLSTLDCVGLDTTILCWGRENIRSHFTVTNFKTEQYFLCFFGPAASTSFPQGEDHRAYFFTS